MAFRIIHPVSTHERAPNFSVRTFLACNLWLSGNNPQDIKNICIQILKHFFLMKFMEDFQIGPNGQAVQENVVKVQGSRPVTAQILHHNLEVFPVLDRLTNLNNVEIQNKNVAHSDAVQVCLRANDIGVSHVFHANIFY